MFAAKYGQRDVAAYLLDEAGADPTLRMKNESSAFDWCARAHTHTHTHTHTHAHASKGTPSSKGRAFLQRFL